MTFVLYLASTPSQSRCKSCSIGFLFKDMLFLQMGPNSKLSEAHKLQAMPCRVRRLFCCRGRLKVPPRLPLGFCAGGMVLRIGDP